MSTFTPDTERNPAPTEVTPPAQSVEAAVPEVTAEEIPAVEATPVAQAEEAPAAEATLVAQAEEAPAAEATPVAQAEEAPAAEATPVAQAEEAPAAPPPPPPKKSPTDCLVVRNFRNLNLARDASRLKSDLNVSPEDTTFLRLQSFFRNTAKRDPTVGELRLLDALDRMGKERPERIAWGELNTNSQALADTWADMMLRHGQLFGVGSALMRRQAAAAPPCPLPQTLSLTGRYIGRVEHRPLPAVALLQHPVAEAEASAAGYAPVARLTADEAPLSLWARPKARPEPSNPQTGDLILLLPQADSETVRTLLAADAVARQPLMGELRAVAASSLLLTLCEMCPGFELYCDRLPGGITADGNLPLALLCGRPTVTSGACDYLIRVGKKQSTALTERIKSLGLTALPCGRIRAKGQASIYIRDDAARREVAVVNLPAAFLSTMAALYLYGVTVEEKEQPLPPVTVPRLGVEAPKTEEVAPINEVIAPVEAPEAETHGVDTPETSEAETPETTETPDAPEAEAPEAEAPAIMEEPLPPSTGEGLLEIPEAHVVVSAATVAIDAGGVGYKAAAHALLTAVDAVAAAGAHPAAISATVSLTVQAEELWRDSRVTEAICGLYRAAAERGIPMHDPSLTVSPTMDTPVRVTVFAAADRA